MEKEELNSYYYNLQTEYMFVGALYRQPDLYLLYGNSIKSEYDFYDESTRFFYDSFEIMYKTLTGIIDERGINTFMSMTSDRFALYKKYQGYKTLGSYIEAAHPEDCRQYYNLVKKYSVVREYQKKGFPIDKLVSTKEFQTMTAKDVVRLYQNLTNRINTVILCEEDSAVINASCTDTIKKYLITPQMGLRTPWEGYDLIFRGCRLSKVIFDGMLSNEGKTRKMMQLAAYITLVQDESFLLMSNEMDEQDLRDCFITTVLNNDSFKSIHGIELNKKEAEIVLGQYRDDSTGKFMQRLTDGFGNFLETEDEYIDRVRLNSEEFRKVEKIAEWADRKREKNLFFKDVGQDYSDQALELEIKRHKTQYGVKYYGYDTLKGYHTDDWQRVKQTATFLKELVKEEKLFLYAVFQLTDDTAFTNVFDLSSNNIANAKQIKHVADHLVLNMRLNVDDYEKYEYIPFDKSENWGMNSSLDPQKVYYGSKIDKNRAADKSKLLLFEVNLDYNVWNNVGILVRKK